MAEPSSLVIERTATLRAPLSQALPAWASETAACLAAPQVTPYRGLVEIMFGTNGLDWRPVLSAPQRDASPRFSAAGPGGPGAPVTAGSGPSRAPAIAGDGPSRAPAIAGDRPSCLPVMAGEGPPSTTLPRPTPQVLDSPTARTIGQGRSGLPEDSGVARLALSQAALAAGAIDLLGELPPCDALVLLTDSVDQDFHTSTVGALAARYGLSKSVHFALSSLEGAALGAGLDILDALLPAGRADARALLVAAEAWPTPFPRPYPAGTILADGATACLVRRGGGPGGLQVLAAAQSAGEPFLDEQAPSRIDRDRLLHAAAGFLADLLHTRAATPDCWIDSGLGDGIDQELRAMLGLAGLPVIATPADEGYLAAAAAPARLSDVLDRVRTGQVAPGTLFLAWGAGLGGVLGGLLIRASGLDAQGLDASGPDAPPPDAPGSEAPGPDVLGPQALGPQALGPQALGPQALGSETPPPEALGRDAPPPEAPGSEAPGPDVLGPQALGPQALGPQALGPQAPPPGRDTPAPDTLGSGGPA